MVFIFNHGPWQKNILATGSIKTKSGIKKLDNFVLRPNYIIEHLRERIQQRILKVLAGKPYNGVIQALVMGDDSQIVQWRNRDGFCKSSSYSNFKLANSRQTLLA
jgi:competence protein ComEC